MTRPLTEREFQKQVTDLAELYQWEWVHTRNARTMDSWRTPMSGTMAVGFPDLILIHPMQRRLIWAELKVDTGKLTAHQERVLDVFRRLTDYRGRIVIETFVWRPSDWEQIRRILEQREEQVAS